MRRFAWIALAVLAATGFGFGDLERGNRLYRQGRFAEAVAAYTAALERGNDTPELRYNLGTALVRLGRHDEADPHLRAALAATQPGLRERSFYNLGNRFLSAARAAQDPAERARLLDGAVEAYKQALRIAPEDTDAKWNLELALRDREDQRRQPQSSAGDDQQPQQQREPEDDDPSPGQGGSPGRPDPREQERGDGASGLEPMSREQAERILAAAEQDERDLYRERLRRGQRQRPVERDW